MKRISPELSSMALIPKSTVLAVCGSVSDMTLWRWRQDPELGFPQPVNIKGQNSYWRESEVIE
jgi:predicted DNA-binding transcriptional regulator AlpA